MHESEEEEGTWTCWCEWRIIYMKMQKSF